MTCTNLDSPRDAAAQSGAPESNDGPLSEAPSSRRDCADLAYAMAVMTAQAEQTNRALLVMAEATKSLAEQAAAILQQNSAILEALAEREDEEEAADTPRYLDARSLE